MDGTPTIRALSNEILSAILSSFSTIALLPMTLTSHRLYDIIVRILQTRLLNASALKRHKLILECFHPSAKVCTPYLFVDNLRTGSCDKIESEPQILTKLTEPRGIDDPNSLSKIQTEYVCQNVNLESHELFSQFCTLTNMVKEGLKPGIFSSCVNISGGVIRVWRDWLAERCEFAKCNRFNSGQGIKEVEDEESKKGRLWADSSENVGLRIQVTQRDDGLKQILAGPGEETSVSYTLQYEELVIQTTQLLLTLERSIDRGRHFI